MGEYLSKADRTKHTEVGENQQVSFFYNFKTNLIYLGSICSYWYVGLAQINGRCSYC